MDSLTPKMVYTMYHTMVLLEKCQNQNSTFSPWVPIYGDPQNDLNDLEKIHPYDFWLDGPLKMPNQP